VPRKRQPVQWYPAEPAIRALEQRCKSSPLRALAGDIKIDRRTLERLRHRRRLRLDCADRIAVALGRHPSELWPEWFCDSSQP